MRIFITANTGLLLFYQLDGYAKVDQEYRLSAVFDDAASPQNVVINGDSSAWKRKNNDSQRQELSISANYARRGRFCRAGPDGFLVLFFCFISIFMPTTLRKHETRQTPIKKLKQSELRLSRTVYPKK